MFSLYAPSGRYDRTATRGDDHCLPSCGFVLVGVVRSFAAGLLIQSGVILQYLEINTSYQETNAVNRVRFRRGRGRRRAAAVIAAAPGAAMRHPRYAHQQASRGAGESDVRG